MSDRIAELLAKGQTGSLTPAEVDELARLLNAPVLEPPARPAFRSARPFKPTDVAGRLRAIDWFTRCGEPLSLALTMPIERAAGWAQAAWWLTDPVWGWVQMEAQNQLTTWLHQHRNEDYQRWNDLVIGFKEAILEPLARDRWVPYQRAQGLEDGIVHSVLWDALGALMENAYLGAGHGCTFFLELLTVYEAGHFPCGWRGEWPNGTLIVY